jgi:hypothetical protein
LDFGLGFGFLGVGIWVFEIWGLWIVTYYPPVEA